MRRAQVNLEAGTAKVTFDPARTSRAEMAKAIEEEGYRVSS
ncbi:MAG: hypothetical protein NUW12_11885 [Firmicutes bacterium]|nr:hypothetical protein [Bacillota bacterium]MDH7496567.1 heavy-metal-associated domain-containing protein [Bacillota bacterium]